MVGPKQKKEAVKHVLAQGLCSLRRACKYLGLHRSTYLYEHKEATEYTHKLVERIIVISKKHPRYGYRRIRALLTHEGWQVSRKFAQKVRRVEGLGVRSPRKRRRRQGQSTASPTRAVQPNHVWSWDFVADRTDRGGPLRIMTLIDEHTRQCLAIKAARSLKSADVVEVLNQAIRENGTPQCIRSDNGSEFIAHKVKEELQRQKIAIVYIDPGSPWLPSVATPQRAIARITNGHIESFHNRLRDECLNQELFLSVTEARVVIEQWRHRYNAEHPHSRLGFLSPNTFARLWRTINKAGAGSIRPTASLRHPLQNLQYLTYGNTLT